MKNSLENVLSKISNLAGRTVEYGPLNQPITAHVLSERASLRLGKYPPTTSHLTLRWIVAQKGDFNSFIPATIKTVLGANPVLVVRRWIAKDIRSLSSQSECAFNAIHWLWLIDNWPTPNISGFIGQWVTAPHRHREGMGSNPVKVLNFSGFSMQLLKLHS